MCSKCFRYFIGTLAECKNQGRIGGIMIRGRRANLFQTRCEEGARPMLCDR